MRKANSWPGAKLLWLLSMALLGWAGGCASDAGSTAVVGDVGRLVIKRSFTLGGVALLLKIDGQQVTSITYNRGYDAPIAAGPHTIGLVQLPDTVTSRAEPIRLVVRKGKTYQLNATRVGHQVTLQ